MLALAQALSTLGVSLAGVFLLARLPPSSPVAAYVGQVVLLIVGAILPPLLLLYLSSRSRLAWALWWVIVVDSGFKLVTGLALGLRWEPTPVFGFDLPWSLGLSLAAGAAGTLVAVALYTLAMTRAGVHAGNPGAEGSATSRTSGSS
jgi:hypothetical protein